MSDPTHEPAGHHLSRTRLNGWKEIAAYLGRGVRTAQRWEGEFGLPVRRMGRDRGESVFAFTDEVDAWLTSSSAAKARGNDPAAARDADGAAETSVGLPGQARPGVRRRWLLLALAVAAVILALAAAGLWR